MTTITKEYTTSTAWTIANALRAAAVHYRGCAESLLECTSASVTGRLQEQFNKQADEAIAFALEFETSDGFSILNVELEI